VKLPIELKNATNNFLRQSNRIVKVAYYCFHLSYRIDRSIMVRHAVYEEANPKNPPDSPWNGILLTGTFDASKWVQIPSLVQRWTAAHAQGLMTANAESGSVP
jgi:hypothetical protein